MSLISLLASRNYIVLNKELAKKIGLEETIVLGELASEFEYWLDREELEDGYFYSTIENIENNTTLNSYKQRVILKNLENLDIIKIKLKGMPAKRYIKINEDTVVKILNIKIFKNYTTTCLNFKQQDIKKLNINNNNINNNKNNNKYIYIVEYLNEKANTKYKTTTDKTRSLINARLKDGFTLEDFKKVIDNKVQEWKGTEMEKYLRPETLFGTKFESYLNQKSKTPSWFNENIKKEEVELTDEEKKYFGIE